ncbi:hypothetical protein N431DRAFT_451717 [Stipitochalara longipes BDJ]|nr:hypothetical protein N431DRAFT_451717 [Stipitochalara longipes BDJ]
MELFSTIKGIHFRIFLETSWYTEVTMSDKKPHSATSEVVAFLLNSHADIYKDVNEIAIRKDWKLKPSAYPASDISSLIVDLMEHSIFMQVTGGEERFLRNLEDPLKEGENRNVEILTMLLTAFPIFDRAFFFASLGEELLIDNILKTGIHAVYVHEKRTIHIGLETRRFDPTRGPHKEALLTILLHEMLHAFMDIFGIVLASAMQWMQSPKLSRETSCGIQTLQLQSLLNLGN